MPISTLPSPSARTHSCDLVYLRSAGTLLMGNPWLLGNPSGHEGLAVAHERRLDDSGVQQLAADVYLHALRCRGWNTREGDRALEGRRESTAGDLAFARAGGQHFLVTAQYPSILEEQPDELGSRTAAHDLLEGSAADEVAAGRVERHRPG